MYKDEHIVIIGASSGIGRSLALKLSQEGATLTLCARSEDKLNKLQKELPTKSYVHPVDITKLDQLKALFSKTEKVIDRVIIMAATYNAPTSISDINLDATSKLIHVNLTGVINCVKLALNKLEEQKHGQIAICSSVAGYMGLPKGQPYSATKAALINFTETLKLEVPSYIDIKLINPGFVKTSLTDKNNFDMPFIITPDEAACYIAKGLSSNSFEITFPKRFTYILKSIQRLPYLLKNYILKKL